MERPNGDEGPRRRGQRGHLMAGLMAAVAIMMIFSTVVFQEWSEVLRRDNEAEMIFRAQDLVRAIQRYRLDHGGQSPVKLEDLMEPGPKGQYYLRKLWEDPLVPDGKWGLLFVGPGGTLVDPTAEGAVGEQPPGAGGIGGGLRPPRPLSPDRGNQARPGGGQGVGGLGATATPGGAGGGDAVGLPIAGVKSLATDTPFRYYKGLTEYGQWLFTYFDIEAAQQQRPPGSGAQTTQPPGGFGFGKGKFGKGKGIGKGAGKTP